ncbi:serine hydrolase domain-containing protein [uncultured Aquimarina sp.]|uniref:serine hydrolase domain-containing protein n=1 Tax=uncultured Aquimarina sp. TaxID=575652 RepID=UPI00262A8330|nr:serine hydrolase domain-containing protein [uncultured Aquimarina sp.]
MTQSKRVGIKIISVCIYMLSIGTVQSQNSTVQVGKIDMLFNDWNQGETPGASVAVIKNGTIIFKKAYGLGNIENNIPNTTSSLFNIASNSKQFTAFAALLLEEEGKLSLEDDIRKYIPELPDFGYTIKVKNLAQHTHGIRGVIYLLGMAGWNIEDVITKKDVFKLFRQQRELNFPPETDFLYNNSGYILLAEIITRVSGKPFHMYLRDHIFMPLEMRNTITLEDNSKIINNISYPYYYDGKSYKVAIRNSKDIVGPTGIRTSTEDLTKWLKNFENPKVGNRKMMTKLITPTILKNGDTLSYALGQVVHSYKNHKVISHGGSDAGYKSQILRFPEEKLSIIVLTNNGSLNAEEKAYRIADLYLNNDMKSLKTGPNPKVLSTPAITEETLTKYEGKFQLQPGFVLEFNQKEGSLFITATGQGTLPLEIISETQFRIRRIDAIITFIKDKDGVVNIVSFDHNGTVNSAKRITYDIDKSILEKYAGTYYSEELNTSYKLSIQNGQLIASHQRQDNTKLTALERTKFTGNTWFFGILDFIIHEDDVTGFKVSSERVKNLWFEKRI